MVTPAQVSGARVAGPLAQGAEALDQGATVPAGPRFLWMLRALGPARPGGVSAGLWGEQGRGPAAPAVAGRTEKGPGDARPKHTQPGAAPMASKGTSREGGESRAQAPPPTPSQPRPASEQTPSPGAGRGARGHRARATWLVGGRAGMPPGLGPPGATSAGSPRDGGRGPQPGPVSPGQAPPFGGSCLFQQPAGPASCPREDSAPGSPRALSGAQDGPGLAQHNQCPLTPGPARPLPPSPFNLVLIEDDNIQHNKAGSTF